MPCMRERGRLKSTETVFFVFYIYRVRLPGIFLFPVFWLIIDLMQFC